MAFQKIGQASETTAKSLKKPRIYRVSISFESDTSPIENVRETIIARSPKSATSRAATLANRKRPYRRPFRSWVIVVEDMGPESEIAKIVGEARLIQNSEKVEQRKS